MWPYPSAYLAFDSDGTVFAINIVWIPERKVSESTNVLIRGNIMLKFWNFESRYRLQDCRLRNVHDVSTVVIRQMPFLKWLCFASSFIARDSVRIVVSPSLRSDCRGVRGRI